ncbi:coniferyl aldehyde dehydrogenase [Usitatibacter palustris]|uniref:Aldehyde dehydrogenase n=1 Tax=Usitatibacter palustris TaxID=2732487 RepID=A0A6M4HAX1_9PROT|nr:coniferyl aldehyde dehydrogenase [Usitatibacter palustris]QJR15177.1 Coniferyl aldehyde dehydrogenase [Usitatibacter palustris]
MNLKDVPPSKAPETTPLEALFARQRALSQGGLGLDAGQRAAALSALEALLREHGREIAAAIHADFGGRSVHETQLLEIFPSIEALRHARRHFRAWMRPRRRATNLWFLPGRSRLIAQPLGVVGIVVPWNYPLYLAIGPIASAISAGNRVLVKMSEVAPATGALFEKLVAQRFDPAVLAVVNGGPEIAREFSALPFDHLLFTGSTAVGRHVMRAAAENLTPVTLELGGKSPAIVGRDFSVAQAADRILYGKCLNAGQTCIAPDYVLVPEERVAEFVDAAKASVARLYPRIADNPDFTSIVNDRQHARLAGYVDDAAAKGARVVELNPAGEDLKATRKIAPRLLLDVNDTMTVMREEIFGPLLPIIPYKSLDEAIAFVNARPRPLALYVFDHDGGNVDRVLAETVSGGVSVNETILHIAQDDLPFGGVGPSGMGRYHGREGFETFSHLKSVFHQSRLNGLALFRPPYGKRFESLVKFLFR